MSNCPTRICVGCRKMRPRDEMLRLTRDYATGQVVLNTARQGAFGRSAYLCLDSSCFEKCQKKSKLINALSRRPRKDGKESSLPRPRIDPQVIKAISDLCTDSDKNMPKY
ncbi:MAG: YlxR family protein [Cyanobacteria bacterium]|nr:YlxR family protein [Cyanobacteriota bacterium]